MELQKAEDKFKKLERYIPFLETFCGKYDIANTKNESAAQKLDKAKKLLGMLKEGYKR